MSGQDDAVELFQMPDDDVESFQCTFCAESFARKKKLLNHLKKRHDILQPFQCPLCVKRFASHSTLRIHLKLYCKRKMETNFRNYNKYTLPAFVVNVRTDIWTPTYGDMLTFTAVGDGNVVASFKGNIVGQVPYALKAPLADFLIYGSIQVKITGTLINGLHSAKLPADYIFTSAKHIVENVISEIESC